jgi:hypothetical protein
MTVERYVRVIAGFYADSIGRITEQISTHRFAVSINGHRILLSRFEIERLKPRQRRDYRKKQRGH